MSTLILLATIAAVHLMAAISPGPSFVVVARNAVALSRGDALTAALAMGIGAAFYAAVVLLGLKTLIDKVPALFLILRIAGALFLVYLAISIIRHARAPLPQMDMRGQDAARTRNLRRSFLFTLWTQLSNPKCILFFAAIFAALLPPDMPAWMAPALVAIVFIQESLWYALVAIGLSMHGPRALYARAKTGLDCVIGAFIGFVGLKLLWDSRAI